MSASQILLAGHGQEDQWLSDNPNRTYFEAKYQPRVNRSRETYEIPFDNQVTFDSTGRCTIPVKGDYMTRMTLRAVMPPIYPTVPGQYVFPTPSSEVGATVYVNKTLDLVVADGVTLTANTVGNHYFSIGAQVTLVGTAYVIFDLDGTYTITGIPTANSFTCSTTLAGISYNGTVSTPGIQCGDIISYFSTTNSNLWVNNVTNKTWQITGGTVVGSQVTFTTSAPSKFPIGSQVVLNLPVMGYINYITTVISSTDTTFTCDLPPTVVGCNGTSVIRSIDDGKTWSVVSTAPFFQTLGFGNGTFVSGDLYSTDNGSTWIGSSATGEPYGQYNIAYGNGTFVAGAFDDLNQVYEQPSEIYRSTDNGQTWVSSPFPPSAYWGGKAFGNDTFVCVSFYDVSFGPGSIVYSTDNGQTWASSSFPGYWRDVAYGNGVFVAVGYGQIAFSANGQTWTNSDYTPSEFFTRVEFGNGTFIAVVASNTGSIIRSTTNGQTWTENQDYYNLIKLNITFGNGTFLIGCNESNLRSEDNGQTWFNENIGQSLFIACFGLAFGSSPSNSVSLVVPPFQLTNRVFSSDAYPSISFANSADAAFWGFDSREGLAYSLPATPPWTYTQSGWISGFLPPSTSTYDDSVAHKLCKEVRLLVGKQTIKEYSGEYIELQNDLLVQYENKAILKLMNGTLDQTQATVAREYYVNLPLGTKEVPLCALTHQNMSVEVDFDSYLNLSQNLNQGTGDFLDAKSYTTYDASTGLLNGQPVNVQTTFSYQQYIFIVTYGGQFIIFDTTKNVDDPTSYIVLSAFSGSNLFKQFCVLSGNLYIGLTDGQLLRGIITELIQGNTSSLEINSYTPTIGSLTGTIVADFRYVYYTVSNTASSNVFVTKYDTTGTFTNPSSYTTVDFTKTFNSSVTGAYQVLSTGTELILLPQGTPGKLYTYQLNANVQSQWYVLDYSLYGIQVTEGVVIENALYFLIDKFNILKYTNSIFTFFRLTSIFIAIFPTYHPEIYNIKNDIKYSTDVGETWNDCVAGYVYDGGPLSITHGNGIVIASGGTGSGAPSQWYSYDDGRSFISNYGILDKPVSGLGVSYGEGSSFIGYNGLDGYKSYTDDNWQTWTNVLLAYDYIVNSVVFGNGIFVGVGDNIIRSTDNGHTWTISLYGSYQQSVAFGNETFVAVGTNKISYSIDNGQTWTQLAFSGSWTDIEYINGTFVTVGYYESAYSTDNGQTWTYVTLPSYGYKIAYASGTIITVGAFSTDIGKTWNTLITGSFIDITALPEVLTFPGDGLRNLIAVGNYIYCSTNQVAVQIDTSKDLSTAAAYTFPAPLPVGQYVFANGPRYVYMFAQGDNTATNIVEFDPYGPDQTFKASILVDYESLPEGVKKPDKALLGLIQTQKVTDMTQMNIKGPVKELWVTGASATTNVFQYSNLATRSTLELAGEQIVTDDVGTRTFFNVIEPFETHTAMPIRNFSVLSFEFDPESEIPNGTVNFSRIRDQIFDGGAETVWARTYNLFAIQGGIGNLMYN